SSGSRSSINSVEPLMSANSAVTVLRSPSRFSAAGVWAVRIAGSLDFFAATPEGVPSAAPHASQNFASGRFSAPHDGHAGNSRPPHLSQNFAASRFSVSHFAQRIRFTQRAGTPSLYIIHRLKGTICDVMNAKSAKLERGQDLSPGPLFPLVFNGPALQAFFPPRLGTLPRPTRYLIQLGRLRRLNSLRMSSS
ncbi:MAG: hypothetical protein QOK03_1762, partial [Candidatus Binataceae bacterium]|nr:hypothetical protein [Candidatus Binataceae bacterium]